MPHPRTARKIAQRQVMKRVRHAIRPKPQPKVDRKALADRLTALLALQVETLERRGAARAEVTALRQSLARLATPADKPKNRHAHK